MRSYTDTSVLVSPYVQDNYSALADKLLTSDERIFLTPLHVAEWTHAIAQHVFRGLMPLSQAERLMDQFQTDRSTGLWIEVAFPENAFELCANLAQKYGPTIGMRTLDTLHVACALELKAERFWTFDERQKKLAKAQGLKTTWHHENR